MIKIIKMTNGETIIATVVDEDNNFITFSDPFQFHEGTSDPDDGYISPWIPATSDETFSVPADTVYVTARPSDFIIEYYEYMISEHKSEELVETKITDDIEYLKLVLHNWDVSGVRSN